MLNAATAATWERSVADAMALTMPSTALPPPVGASSKNGLDEAKPAFFGGCPSVVSLTFRQSPIIHDPFFFVGILCVQIKDR